MIFCILSFAAEEIFADFEVYAKQSSKLAFESSGKVDKIFVDVSSHVKKGDVLASLDQTSLEIALKKAKNDLALAKNAKEFAKSTFNKFSLASSSAILLAWLILLVAKKSKIFHLKLTPNLLPCVSSFRYLSRYGW